MFEFAKSVGYRRAGYISALRPGVIDDEPGRDLFVGSSDKQVDDRDTLRRRTESKMPEHSDRLRSQSDQHDKASKVVVATILLLIN
jgi:hypothetical protein